MACPEFFSLKSETNSRYLRWVRGLLQFSGEEVVSPYTKFHAEKASVDPNQVNIQSCYNNKYLMRADKQEDKNSKGWIVAWADDKQEDTRLPNCTLFQPTSEGAQIKFCHVQSSAFLKISDVNECLFVSPDSQSLFTVIDWNKLVILPKHLAFKGNNGKYINVMEEESPHLKFSGIDATAKKAENEVFAAGDGSVRINSTDKQKLWKRKIGEEPYLNNWILADGDDNKVNTWFWPAKVDPLDDVVVSLKNLGNSLVCSRLSRNNNDHEGSLIANLPPNNITADAYLAVEELVKSRTISILNFHPLTDGRVYKRNINKVVTFGIAENPNQVPVSRTICLNYEDTKTSTWHTNTDDLAFTAFIKTTLASDTPFVLDGGRIGVSGNFNGTYQWGEPHSSSTKINFRVRVVVPALRTVTVTLKATEASCDIPFNYSKIDTIGQRTTYEEGVGLYTGVGLYDFHYNIEDGQPEGHPKPNLYE